MNREQALARFRADRARMNQQRELAIDAAIAAITKAIGPAISATRDIPGLVEAIGTLYDEGYQNGNSDAYKDAADEARELAREQSGRGGW